MKKIFSFALLMAVLSSATFVQAQEVPTSFPRKFLLEHFTGEGCGYCPAGMDAIVEALEGQEEQYIWVSHHAGYSADTYTISANNTIVRFLGVSGAPSMSLNRTARRVDGASARVFHPGYLPELTITDATTASASVVVEPTFDAETRALSVKVSGQVADTSLHALKLSVLIKENGLVSEQADYYETYEGWSEFLHTRVVRQMLSAALGDAVEVENQAYDSTYTITLNANFKAENCVVVAYITEDKSGVLPIINAEQAPVVAGTTGGEEMNPYGITREPVDETYPESGKPKTDVTFDDYATEYASGVLHLMMMDTKNGIRSGGYTCYPYADLYIVTSSRDLESLALGTYPINTTEMDGTVIAGVRNDEEMAVEGSQLYYVFNYGGSLYIQKQWLATSGELVIEEGSLTLNMTTRNGSPFTGTYYFERTALDDVTVDGASAEKVFRNGQLLILRGDKVYSPTGARLQ